MEQTSMSNQSPSLHVSCLSLHVSWLLCPYLPVVPKPQQPSTPPFLVSFLADFGREIHLLGRESGPAMHVYA